MDRERGPLWRDEHGDEEDERRQQKELADVPGTAHQALAARSRRSVRRGKALVLRENLRRAELLAHGLQRLDCLLLHLRRHIVS